ncbi:heavy-metal-associated domain-containing protein [Halolamina sp. C58]|uniref:heavy-metal-associated domain-containing protein n=1 Tax=Halolamina sp. C58 TaxID=3421640 RepID=UPI003EBF5352
MTEESVSYTGMGIQITVKGMTCDGCEQTVQEALEGVAGVEDTTADRTSDLVTIDGDAALDDLRQAVEDAGYIVVG